MKIKRSIYDLLLSTLFILTCCVAVFPVNIYASDLEDKNPPIKIKWIPSFDSGYVGLSVENDGDKPIKISSQLRVYSGGLTQKVDFSPTVNSAFIYPVIILREKPGKSYSPLSPDMGVELAPFTIAPGETKVIKLQLDQNLVEIVKDYYGADFLLILNNNNLSKISMQYLDKVWKKI